MATEFGTKVDTFAYTMGINYRLIKKFNFGSNEIYYKEARICSRDRSKTDDDWWYWVYKGPTDKHRL